MVAPTVVHVKPSSVLRLTQQLLPQQPQLQPQHLLPPQPELPPQPQLQPQQLLLPQQLPRPQLQQPQDRKCWCFGVQETCPMNNPKWQPTQMAMLLTSNGLAELTSDQAQQDVLSFGKINFTLLARFQLVLLS